MPGKLAKERSKAHTARCAENLAREKANALRESNRLLIHQRDELLATIIAAASLANHGSAAKQLLDEAIANAKGGAA